MKPFYLFICLFMVQNARSQNRDAIWMLGYGNSNTILKPSISFLNGTADTFSFPRPMEFFTTNSSICDTSGQLLFYTNGHYIENKLGDTLLNSNNFNPGWLTDNGPSLGLGVSQGSLTLPFPDDSSKYIIFHESGDPPYNYQLAGDTNWYPSVQPFHLGYSIVDMTLDSGLGGIISGLKDIHAIDDTLFQGWITACKHGNGRDWWVIVHKWYSDHFYKFLITPQGVSLPDTQIIGPVMMPSDGLRDFDRIGQACFSPDGSKYAMAGQSNIIHLFDFDRCSGLLHNYRETSIDTIDRVRACSFSPNSRFLYVSHLYHNFYQFDTWQTNLNSAGIIVAQWDTMMDTTFNIPVYIFMHQLAPDGKIYVSTFNGSKYFHIIDEPDSLGFGCNFMQHVLDLTNYNLTIPNFPNYNLGPLTGSACDTLTSVNELVQNAPLQLKVFPNPVVTDDVFINYSLEQNKTGLLQIFNTTGQVVYKQRLPQWSSQQHIYLPELSDGVYLVRLRSGDKVVSKKFVKIP